MARNDEADEAALDDSYETLQPINVVEAEKVLKEIKPILNGIMPWDDDLDLGVVMGLYGATEELIDPVVTAFKNNDFITGIRPQDQHISVPLLKSTIRTDLQFHRIINGHIFHYPGIMTPLRLFTDLKEIDFLGEKFYVRTRPRNTCALNTERTGEHRSQ